VTFGRWVIVALIAVVVVGTAYWVASKPTTAGYGTLTAEELQARIGAGAKMVIVDLREPDLYRAGHIPGAKNIPFEEFNNRTSELSPDDETVLVCHMGQMGDVSGTLLAQLGYPRVWNLARGMAGWSGGLAK